MLYSKQELRRMKDSPIGNKTIKRLTSGLDLLDYCYLLRLTDYCIISTSINMVFTSALILAVDAYGIYNMRWGNQLYITMIETAVLSILIIILSVVELCKIK
jgi:hypothetical protein